MEELTTKYKGRAFNYPKDSMIGECIAEQVGWDRVLIPILKFFFSEKTAPIITEVGTNIAGSLLQMEIALPNAKFYCFEPADRFYYFAKKNIKENTWDNVTLEKICISDEVKEVRLNINPSTASAAINEYSEHIRTLSPVGSQIVKTLPLDSYFKYQKIDFLKIDTDGYETKIINAAKGLIERSKCTIFLEFDPRMMNQGGSDPKRLLEMFGYTWL